MAADAKAVMGFDMAEAAGNINEREHRQRVLKGASILTGVNNSEIRCTVRNMHGGGAELRIEIGSIVPNEFLLYVPIDETGYKSVVRWRHGDRIGVMFVGTAPKPHWHYG